MLCLCTLLWVPALLLLIHCIIVVLLILHGKFSLLPYGPAHVVDIHVSLSSLLPLCIAARHQSGARLETSHLHLHAHVPIVHACTNIPCCPFPKLHDELPHCSMLCFAFCSQGANIALLDFMA